MIIRTFQTKDELIRKHNFLSFYFSNKDIDVTDIFESDISFSFRVFVNKNTISFFQYLKK